MRILEKEISLRDETRTAEQARTALVADEYGRQAESLSETQKDLAVRVADVTKEIRQLPGGDLSFMKEIALLMRVEQVMHEARHLLARPETGPEPIAAETEAIELLLQARRSNPQGGGGGGGTTPGGGGDGDTEQSALALIGAGTEQNAQSQDRSVGQATGVSGSELPAEFRGGLDAYFGALEGNGVGSE